jgi:hypothetical protein
MERPMAPENEQQNIPELKDAVPVRAPANEGTTAEERMLGDLPPITGDRKLDAVELDLINTVKQHGDILGNVISALEKRDDVDKRWLAIAKTDLQKGMMALVRSIAKPTNF